MPVPPLYPPPLACRTEIADVRVAEAAAGRAYLSETQDLVAFHAALAHVQRDLPCLHAALSRADAAGVHQLFGIAAALARDDVGTRAALQAAHAADPGTALSADLLAFRAIRTASEDAERFPTDARVAVVVPEGTHLLVDGAPATEVPVDRPYIAQVIWDADGQVHWTGYLQGAGLDLALLGPPPPPPPPPRPPEPCPICSDVQTATPPLHQVSRPLGVGALGSTALAVGLYGAAAITYRNYYDPATPSDQQPGLQARTNALQKSAIGVGGVAIGLDSWLLVQIFRAAQDGP